MGLEKFTQVLSWRRIRGRPEVRSSDRHSLAFLIEVRDHFGHVCISGHSDKVLFEHAAEGQHRHFESGLGRPCVPATRLLDEVE